MLVYYVDILINSESISPVEYIAYESDEITDDSNILNESCGGFIYEFGVDYMPAVVDDIRGKIKNEPDRFFAEVFNPEDVKSRVIRYFGLQPFFEHKK